ncbi:hypothetical protein [Dokdonella sp.]|uniref:hypothetical protein n=1 Tax=Dokdonella sp. TaxID=2291710 RepID=UPI001B256367|nr:hypothetical protein [Dokdonella sp.]MBO9662089.1 hypothetical protein [Dokdonella sp.]
MSELAWALTILIVAAAAAGALCDALLRNTVAAFFLSAAVRSERGGISRREAIRSGPSRRSSSCRPSSPRRSS